MRILGIIRAAVPAAAPRRARPSRPAKSAGAQSVRIPGAVRFPPAPVSARRSTPLRSCRTDARPAPAPLFPPPHGMAGPPAARVPPRTAATPSAGTPPKSQATSPVAKTRMSSRTNLCASRPTSIVFKTTRVYSKDETGLTARFVYSLIPSGLISPLSLHFQSTLLYPAIQTPAERNSA